MVFIFSKNHTVHTQYLAQDYNYNYMRPMTNLYYNLIDMYKNMGFTYLTWGISTQNKGKVLNANLLKFKESFGSKHVINKSYYKDFFGGQNE